MISTEICKESFTVLLVVTSVKNVLASETIVTVKSTKQMENLEHWHSTTVSNWDSFVALIGSITRRLPNQKHHFLYRGQVDIEWPLKSSLRRKLANEQKINSSQVHKIEKDLKIEFESRVHLYQDNVFKPSKDNWLEWWAIMQHYSAPTRLLDWTNSPYVAAYFAVNQDSDKDGVIWTINDWALGDRMLERYPDDWNEWESSPSPARYWDKVSNSFNKNETLFCDKPNRKVFFFQPEQKSLRVSAQQGWLSATTDHYFSYEKIIGDLFHEHRVQWKFRPEYDDQWKYWNPRIIIKKELKKEFLRQLQLMNITAATIFPGIDGLGKFINEIADISLANKIYGSSHPLL